MDGIRHRERFAEIEALMDNYFRCHIAPVMSKTRTFLTEKQGEEMVEYSTSPGGILSLMASSMQPLADPYQVLKATGEWNSKTTEDYIEMCKAEIAGSEAMQQDLAYMAERWREAVVQEVGRERYDELVAAALDCPHAGRRRLLLALLYRQPQPEPLRVDFLDFCLDAMTDPAQPHAVRMYCMKLACEMCRTQKDLLHEFRTLVELLEPDLLPPSLRAVRRNVLAALDRNRPLPRR